MTRYNRLKIGMDDVGSIVEPTSSLACADVIHTDFQTVISRYLQNIGPYLFCTATRMFRIIIMQNSRLIQASFPIKIDEVWIDRFCVRYDWLMTSTAHQCPQCASWRKKQGKSEGFDTAKGLVILLKLVSNQWLFMLYDKKLDGWPWKK